jgi:predicted small lipoprotein YifL
MSKKIGILVMSVAYISTACGMLTGCGTKGPLYIPEQRYPQASTTKPDGAPKTTDNTQPSTK